MEKEPDYTNVVFIDEYPELAKKVWLRRLAESRRNLGSAALHVLPTPIDFRRRMEGNSDETHPLV